MNHLPIIAGKGHKIFVTRWWSEAMLGVSRLGNYGYSWMPTALPRNTRILRRLKHESGTANSDALGRETSTKRGHGRRKECKYQIYFYIGFTFHLAKVDKILSRFRAGPSSPAGDQRTLLIGRTDCHNCKKILTKEKKIEKELNSLKSLFV